VNSTYHDDIEYLGIINELSTKIEGFDEFVFQNTMCEYLFKDTSFLKLCNKTNIQKDLYSMNAFYITILKDLYINATSS